MKASSFHYKTLKEAPKDAELVSHKLMIRANMIKPLASGIYSWLPLGLKILNKVEEIIRKNMIKYFLFYSGLVHQINEKMSTDCQISLFST